MEGGGSDSISAQSSSTITGQFIDAPVAGLEYKCSSETEGLTDALGYFTCKKGDNVEFSINGLLIGSASVQSVITPLTLAADDNITATNIAQLLQTLDSDNNSSNGITIDSNTTEVQALKNANISMDAVDFDSVVKSYIGKDLVSEATAMAHLELNVKNATNNVGITSQSSVIITTNATQEMCLAQNSNEATFEGYGDFESFVNAGGSASVEYFNGEKSCSEYSSAGFCHAQALPAEIEGSGSCVYVVTYPKTTDSSTTDSSKYISSIFDAVEYANDVTLSTDGTKAYLAATNDGFVIVDVSDPTKPTQLGSYANLYAKNVVLSTDGTKAFIAAGFKGFVILDVSNPTNITQLGSYTNQDADNVVLSTDGTKAYIVSANDGLVVLDVSNPTNITQLGSYANLYGNSVILSSDGTKVYVAAGQGGLVILDVSDPANITQLGSYSRTTNEIAYEVVLSADETKAYIAYAGDGLVIVDVSNPTNPVELGSYEIYGGTTNGVALSNDGTEAYVTAWGFGLIGINVSNPVSPAKFVSMDTGGYTAGVTLSSDGAKAYVVQSNGLAIRSLQD